MKKILFWLTLYTALLGGSYMLYHLVLPIRASFHVVALVVLVIYLYRRGLPDSPMTIPALTMGLVVVVSIPLSVDPRMALDNGWNWIVDVLAFLCLIQVCRDGYSGTLFRAHFWVGGLVAIGALFEWLISGARPQGIFLNISITGAYLAALVIPALNTAREREGLNRLKYYALVALLILAVVVGDNRGALLSVGVAALTYFTLLWKADVSRKLGLWLVCALMLAIPLWLLSLKPEHATGDVVRLDLWRAGGDMIQSYPFGVGPGLFAQAYRAMGTVGENRFADAHNQIITLGAELGALGLAAGAAMVLTALYCLTDLRLSRSQLAALAALMGILAHVMVDSFPSDNWAMLIGLYAAYVLQDAHLAIPRRVIKIASAWAALALTAWTIRMFQFDRAQISYDTALYTGRYYDAFDAVTLDPDMQLYRLELKRLGGEDISQLDSNLALYGLTMYGREFK